MANLRLSAETRSETGKSAGRKLRRAGKVPAVLYGKDRDGVSLSLDNLDVTHLLATHGATTSILELEIKDGGKSLKKNILIKEIQKHPFREEVVHMDLFEVTMDQDVSVMVPVEITGEADGVNE